jgi:hypothetical protein
MHIFASDANVPKFVSALQSTLDETVTVPWLNTVLAVPSENGANKMNFVRKSIQLMISWRFFVTSCSPSYNNSRLIDELVRIRTGRRQTNRYQKVGKNQGIFQCYDGNVIGLTQITINQSSAGKNTTFRVVVMATYKGKGVEVAVNGNFADPPRHLNIWWWTRFTSYCPQTNQYGHLRHLIHRQPLIHAINRRRNALV